MIKKDITTEERKRKNSANSVWSFVPTVLAISHLEWVLLYSLRRVLLSENPPYFFDQLIV